MLQLITKGHGQLPMEAAASDVAVEVSTFYIYYMNIYPKTEFNIASRIKADYKEFKRLVGYPLAKRGGKTFQTAAQEFNKRMAAGYDVKTDDEEREKYLAKFFGVKFGPQESKLYLDNGKIKDWCL